MFRRLTSIIDWIFGFAAVLVLVAVCSVVPVLNFLSLGYLLHVSGQVARTGRLRDGFIGVRKAAVLGRVMAGAWLVLWPARLAAGFWQDAEIVAAGSGIARAWNAGYLVLLALTMLHIAWACLRGARWRHFIWPAPIKLLRWLRAADSLAQVQDAARVYVTGLRLPFYFWLGLRGFVGAVLWLALPVGMLFVATRLPQGAAVLVSLIGGFLLLLVVLQLPFLQARLAESDRWQAVLEWREARRLFRHAPLAYGIALTATLLFAIPLYLLKVELTPDELAWLPALVFVIFIFPARVLTGWALGRALRRETPAHGFWRWLVRLGIVPVALAYVLMVYVAPYVSWNGAWSLLEQHAFLVPAPLMAL